MNLITQVYSLDLRVFHWINRGFNHPLLDQFFNLLADGHFWTPILIVTAIILLLRGRDRVKVWVILTVFSIAIGDPLISNPIKYLFDRARPYQAVEGVREVSPGPKENHWQAAVRISGIPEQDVKHGRSFPSSHVANATAAATSAYLVWGSAMRWPWYLVALAALGRIYTGDHYPTDVLASIPLSMFYTWLIAQVLNRIWIQLGPRYFPKLFARIPSLLHVK
ncbi:MAG: phosphatase PAP2 family protein [Verrucomicrobia bacterium]|nr:phosphatase PAP2 family protein [Verrucomicrobiota bacterium]